LSECTGRFRATSTSISTNRFSARALGLSEDGPLEVGDDLRVPGHEWLYAVGDVNGRVLLTHLQMGYSQAATIESVRSRFDGPVELVEPGSRFTI